MSASYSPEQRALILARFGLEIQDTGGIDPSGPGD